MPRIYEINRAFYICNDLLYDTQGSEIHRLKLQNWPPSSDYSTENKRFSSEVIQSWGSTFYFESLKYVTNEAKILLDLSSGTFGLCKS